MAWSTASVLLPIAMRIFSASSACEHVACSGSAASVSGSRPQDNCDDVGGGGGGGDAVAGGCGKPGNSETWNAPKNE